MMDAYQDFLARKSAEAPSAGIALAGEIHPALKEFQRDLVRWALRGGRRALFAGTGLGKTLMELAWAQAVAREAGGPVLLLAPLAVAEQTVKEAEKFGIAGVRYAADRHAMRGEIVVTNYDRFDKFRIEDFPGVILDESSILKSHDGATRAELTEACQIVPWRLPCSATPAPNDFTEIGQHAEFLGVMRAKEMLAMFFVHDGSIRAGGPASAGASDAAGWRLKRHAEQDFWRWVASWAAMVRHPRDLGYEEAGYDLPPLIKRQITVAADAAAVPEGCLFALEARTLQERLKARRDSLGARVTATADLVNANRDRPWLVWCNLNDEADALERAIPGALQVKGAQDRAMKRERLLGFCDGRPVVLITKPSIAGFGMNWQHCADMAFVGLNDSFEQLYQAIRRCWRFGQGKPVTAWMIAAETEGAVVKNLEAKEAAYERMAEAMAEHCRAFVREQVRGNAGRSVAAPANQPMQIPGWLVAA
jgi:hypothetical protein